MLFSKINRFILITNRCYVLKPIGVNKKFSVTNCCIPRVLNSSVTTLSSGLIIPYKRIHDTSRMNYVNLLSENENKIQKSLKKCLDDAVGKDGVTHQALLVSDETINQFCSNYRMLNDDEKQKTLLLVCKQYGVKHSAVGEACNWFEKNNNSNRDELTLLQAEDRLRIKLHPMYIHLFMLIGRLENGVKFLTDFRFDVLNAISESKNDLSTSTMLRDFSNHLKNTLAVWFSVGLLQRRQINWQTSADILEKIARNEAVHRVVSWLDLRHRLGANRRCYAFFHSSMPREPLVILHVALTNEISSNITDIMDREGIETKTESSNDKKAAIFYSITSTQKGLQGIEFGVHMIRGVVQELSNEFPNLNQFSSLSPIPKFRTWLLENISSNLKQKEAKPTFSQTEISAMSKCFGISEKHVVNHIAHTLQDRSWMKNEEVATVLKPILIRSCAQFLCNTKRRGYAFDPVANFHLHNGATLWRINWMADPSLKGNMESCGMMANYRYYLNNVEENSKQYILKKTVFVSPNVTSLLEQNIKNKL